MQRHTPKESIPLNSLAIVIRPPSYPVQKKTLMMKSKAFLFCFESPSFKSIVDNNNSTQKKKEK